MERAREPTAPRRGQSFPPTTSAAAYFLPPLVTDNDLLQSVNDLAGLPEPRDLAIVASLVSLGALTFSSTA